MTRIVVDDGADDVRRGLHRFVLTSFFPAPIICRTRRNSGQPTPPALGTWMRLGSLTLEGDACVAPTRIFPGPLGLAYKGISWGKSAVIHNADLTIGQAWA